MIFLWFVVLHLLYLFTSALFVPRVESVKLSPAEKAIILLWYLIPCSWWMTRTTPTAEMFTTGFALYASGGVLVTLARIQNPFFTPKIVKPLWVVTGGVYRLKHPGYIGMVAMGFGSVLMLGHVAGLIPLAMYTAILSVRAWEEGRLISSDISPTGSESL